MQNLLIESRFDVLHSFSLTSFLNCTSSSIRKIHHRRSEMYLMAEIKLLQQRWWLDTRWESHEGTATDIPDTRSTIKVITGESISRRCSPHPYIITNLYLYISARLHTRFGRCAIKIPRSRLYLDAVFSNRLAVISVNAGLNRSRDLRGVWPTFSERSPLVDPRMGRGLKMNIHELSRALSITW